MNTKLNFLVVLALLFMLGGNAAPVLAQTEFSVGLVTVVDTYTHEVFTSSVVLTNLEATAVVSGYDSYVDGWNCQVSFGANPAEESFFRPNPAPPYDMYCVGWYHFTTVGTFTITVTVTGPDGTIHSSEATHTVTGTDVAFYEEMPLAPVDLSASVPAEPSMVNQTIAVFGAINDAKAFYSTESCTVDYGDSSEPVAGTLVAESWFAFCQGPEHTYTTPGTYTITMDLSGYNGSSATKSASHEVVQPVLEQMPDHVFLGPADLDYCDNYNGGCRTADNFVVPGGETRKIGRLQLWGYFKDDTGLTATPENDLYTVIFYKADPETGLPGEVVSTDATLSPMRWSTSRNFEDQLTEFMIMLAMPVHTFEAGSYWVEVQEASQSYPIVFNWATGNPDTYGLGKPGLAVYHMQADQDTQVGWNLFGTDPTSLIQNMALRLLPPAPAPSYSISGKVFNDQNVNGAFDAGEPGMSGVTVHLDQGCDGPEFVSATTGEDGSYSFTGQTGQMYCVWVEVPNGYKITFAPPSIASLDADVSGMDYGLTNQPLFSWTPLSPNEGGSATFTAKLDGFVEYGWKITQPGVECYQAGWGSYSDIGQTHDLSFDASGDYQVCLRMDKGGSYVLFDGQPVTVANVAPAPLEAGINPEPSEAGQPITGAWAVFTDQDQLASCTVDYGDGTGLQPGTLPEPRACEGPAHTYTAAGTYTVTFTATDTDGATGTLTTTHVVNPPPVSADLRLTKVDSKDPVRPGAQLVYTLTVKNLGPNTAQTITLVDTLDRNTTYVSVSAPKGWTCKYVNYAVTCTRTSLASGSSATIKITVMVNKTNRLGKELVNNAEVSCATYDPVMINNTVVQKTLVAK